MRIGNGFLVATLLGGIWGFVWMVVIAIIFMLVSGVVTRPPVGIATLAGALSAAALVVFAPKDRSAGVFMTSLVVIMLVLGGLTLAQPMGLPLSQVSLYQVVAVAVLIGPHMAVQSDVS